MVLHYHQFIRSMTSMVVQLYSIRGKFIGRIVNFCILVKTIKLILGEGKSWIVLIDCICCWYCIAVDVMYVDFQLSPT